MSNIFNGAFTNNQSWTRTFSTQGSDMGHTITDRTSRQNHELIKNLKLINPIPALTIKQNNNQAEREFKNIKATINKMNLTLKQLMDAEAKEKVLEVHKSYMLEIYRERTPCYVKVHIRRDKSQINFYMRLDENEDLDENEG
jgi:hypothetical protein